MTYNIVSTICFMSFPGIMSLARKGTAPEAMTSVLLRGDMYEKVKPSPSQLMTDGLRPYLAIIRSAMALLSACGDM